MTKKRLRLLTIMVALTMISGLFSAPSMIVEGAAATVTLIDDFETGIDGWNPVAATAWGTNYNSISAQASNGLIGSGAMSMQLANGLGSGLWMMTKEYSTAVLDSVNMDGIFCYVDTGIYSQYSSWANQSFLLSIALDSDTGTFYGGHSGNPIYCILVSDNGTVTHGNGSIGTNKIGISHSYTLPDFFRGWVFVPMDTSTSANFKSVLVGLPDSYTNTVDIPVNGKQVIVDNICTWKGNASPTDMEYAAMASEAAALSSTTETQSVTYSSLNDTESKVSVKGLFSSSAIMNVTRYQPASAEYAAAQTACNRSVLSYYNIGVSGEQKSPFKVSIPMPSSISGQSKVDVMKVIGDKAVRINAYVYNGYAEFMTPEFGSFALLAPTKTGTGNATSQIEIYVSTTGDDSNTGMSVDDPIKTIDMARQIVRTQNTDMTDNIIVYIRGGKYYLEDELNFSALDSGSNGFDVIYKNYNNEKVEIIGGRSVTGWTQAGTAGGRTIYSAYVGYDIYALYENDTASIMARRDGYARSQGYEGTDKFTFKPEDVTFSPGEVYSNMFVNYWPGAEAYGIEGGGYWINSLVPVEQINGNVATINSPYHPVYTNSKYFFCNVKGELDKPGEFYFDYTTKRVYYIPVGSIGSVDVVAPAMKRAVNFLGTRAENVHNITIDGLRIGKTDSIGTYYWPGGANYMNHETVGAESVIYADYDRNISILNCNISNAGISGITFSSYSQLNSVINNTIENIGFTGVLIQSDAPSVISEYVNKNHLVIGNVIKNVGMRIMHGVGLQVVQSGDNAVMHNELSDGSRIGISMNGAFWESGGFEDTIIDGRVVTIDNFQNWLYSRNNLFAFNKISRFMLDSDDGGVFYSQGCGVGNVLDNNLVLDFGNDSGGGVGIYIDDRSDYFTVKNNIVDATNYVNSFAAYFKGRNNTIRNNIFIANSISASTVYFATFNGAPNHSLVFENNIVVQKGECRRLMGFFDAFTKTDNPARFTSCDNNVYFMTRKDEGDEKFSLGNVYSFEEWKTQFELDENSVFADPLFEIGRYRLKSNSPALELGFVNITTSEIGLGYKDGTTTDPDGNDPDDNNPGTGDQSGLVYVLLSITILVSLRVLNFRKKKSLIE